MAKLDDGFTKRGGVYWIRKTIPAALRAEMGKREIVKSLRTGDQKEAMRLFKIESLKIEEQLEAARQKVAAKTPVEAETVVEDDPSEPPVHRFMTVDALRRDIIESDYRNRVRLFKAAEDNLKAFYAGHLIKIPQTDIADRFREGRDWEALLALLHPLSAQACLHRREACCDAGRHRRHDEGRWRRHPARQEPLASETRPP